MKKVLSLYSIIALLMATAVFAGSDQNIVMEIQGMTCEVCAVAVKRALSDVQGVKRVTVSYDQKKAWLVVDKTVADETLSNALKKAGDYEGKVIERK